MAFDPDAQDIAGAALDLAGRSRADVARRFSSESSTLPFVILIAGQSNGVGADAGGSKAIGANILVTDSFNTPTQLRAAAFGQTPLNLVPSGGTSTNPALVANNQGVQFANSLRASGLIASDRTIVLIPDVRGSQPIAEWDGTSASMWLVLLAQLAVLEAAYPGAKIDHMIWTQGEGDQNSGPNNTRDAYIATFERVVAQFRALPQWQPATTISLTELGCWSNNAYQGRNDALRCFADGARDPYITLVPSTRLVEGVIGDGPHFSGDSLVELGRRHFHAWNLARLNGSYSKGQTTKHGSALGFKALFTVASGDTLSLSPDDLRTGAVIDAAGGTLIVPRAQYCANCEIIIDAAANLVLQAPDVGYMTENAGSLLTSSTLRGGVYRLFVRDTNTWHLETVNPRIGGAQYSSATYAAGATTVLNNTNVRGTRAAGDGGIITLPVYIAGGDYGYHCKPTGSATTITGPAIRLPDGRLVTSLSVSPGETIVFVGANSEWVVSSWTGVKQFPISQMLRRSKAEASLLPFVIYAGGQSNMVGSSVSGSKAVEANILIPNSLTAPTALIPAQFGVAPLNTVPGTLTTSTDPALVGNNQAVQTANALRRSGVLDPTQPIVIIPDWQSSQSLTSWVPTSASLWVRLQAQLAFMDTQYPGWKFNYGMWAQGEQDSGTVGPYNTQATYLAGFLTFVAQLRALTQWPSDTPLAVTELGTWTNNTSYARNDALRQMAEGGIDPYITMVSGSGLVESELGDGPHYSGDSLITLGKRHFAAWNEARLAGTYANPRQTPHGSVHAYGLVLDLVAGQSRNLSPDDLRNGATVNGIGASGNNCSVTIPNSLVVNGKCDILIYSNGFLTLNVPSGGWISENLGGLATTATLTAGRYLLTISGGNWVLSTVFPRVGGSKYYAPIVANGQVVSAASHAAYISGSFVSVSGSAIALTAPSSGSHFGFSGRVGGTASTITANGANQILLPDGQLVTTYTLLPGATAYFVGQNSLWVLAYETGFLHVRHDVTANRPAGLAATERVLFFDDTLNKPIWWKGTAWVDASGATV